MPDILTDREPAQDAPAAPPSGPSYGALAETLEPLKKDLAATRGRIETSMREEAAAVNPKLKAAQELGQRLIRDAEEKYKGVTAASQTVKQVQAAQPSRSLTAFLAPVNNEAPEQSIAKLMQAIGIFGAAVAGSTRGDARAGLAALTGAMKGWKEGDRERSDRHFADWKTHMDTALKASEDERQSYREWFTNANFNVEQMFRGAEMDARMRGNDRLADLFHQQGLESDIAGITTRLFEGQRHEDSLKLQVAHLTQAKDLADRAFAERVREFDQRVKEHLAKQNEDAVPYAPQTIEYEAQMYNMTRVLPSMGFGKASTEARKQIQNRAAEIAKEQGASPADVLARAQFVKSSQSELTKLMSQRGPIIAFSTTAHLNLKIAKELSEKRDDSGVPVANRWINAGKMSVQGDPDVAAFNAAIRIAINEVAKVTSSVTGGGVTSDAARKDIESVLNMAQTKEQVRKVLDDVLEKDMANRIVGYEERIKATQDQVKALMTPPGTTPAADAAQPAAPAKAAGGWRIVK